jgi:hypothetical protein
MASRIAAVARPANVNSPELPEGFLAPVEAGNWRVLRPARESFSVLVPEGEMHDLPDKNGIRDVHLYRARDGRASFVVLWLTGPTYGESDADAIKEGTDSFTKVFGQDTAFGCESMQDDKDISMGGFAGLEFEFKCRLPLRVRVFTRIINGNRQVYLAMVLYREQDANIARFINSFTITTPASTQKSTKSAKTK